MDPHRILYNFWDEGLCFLFWSSLKTSWKIARTLRRQSEFVEIFELWTFFYLWNFWTEDLFFWSSPCSFDPQWNKFLVPPCPSRIHINKLLVPPPKFISALTVTLSWCRAWLLLIFCSFGCKKTLPIYINRYSTKRKIKQKPKYACCVRESARSRQNDSKIVIAKSQFRQKMQKPIT